MAIPEARTVHCGQHGASRVAFVCHHLFDAMGDDRRDPIGFVAPRFDPDDPEDDPQAWCSACDAVVVAAGDWNEDAAAFAQVKGICAGCYEVVREQQKPRSFLSRLLGRP
jgi:hypothetical protein